MVVFTVALTFKDTLGEDGFFMLRSWRALNLYLPLALEMYGDN